MVTREKILGKLYHFRDIYKQKKLQQKFNVTIGKYSYGTPVIHFGKLEDKKLVIGKFCSIGKNVHVYLGGNHRTDWITTYPFPAKFTWAKKIQNYRVSKGDVIIGNDVWIGADVTILSGVAIGDGAVIGAGTVVTKDVPPYSMVVGNPGRVVKYRFDKDDVEYLLQLKWWDWDLKEIEDNIKYLLNDDIQALKMKMR